MVAKAETVKKGKKKKKLLVLKAVKPKLPRSLVRLLSTEGLIVTGCVRFRAPRPK
jgi:hypothetical protein